MRARLGPSGRSTPCAASHARAPGPRKPTRGSGERSAKPSCRAAAASPSGSPKSATAMTPACSRSEAPAARSAPSIGLRGVVTARAPAGCCQDRKTAAAQHLAWISRPRASLIVKVATDFGLIGRHVRQSDGLIEDRRPRRRCDATGDLGVPHDELALLRNRSAAVGNRITDESPPKSLLPQDLD